MTNYELQLSIHEDPDDSIYNSYFLTHHYLEASTGFEPVQDSFADCSLSHLGTTPILLTNF